MLERSPSLLPRQLDARGGELLRDYLEGLGIDVLVQAETETVRANGRVQGVCLRDGRRLDADVFLVAAGITPNTKLAHEAGLDVNRGVIVDDELRASAENVWAAGDVAEHRGKILGLWPTAVEQAEVAAENLLGGERAYEGTLPVTMLKVVGVNLTSIGRIDGVSSTPSGRRLASPRMPVVELLWWDGCPSSEGAHELVRRVMAEAGLDPDALRSIEIDTGAAAEREGFVGSPTVRVDGHDIQPPAEPEPPGLSCRVYHLRDGRVSPLPDPEDIKEALTR